MHKSVKYETCMIQCMLWRTAHAWRWCQWWHQHHWKTMAWWTTHDFIGSLAFMPNEANSCKITWLVVTWQNEGPVKSSESATHTILIKYLCYILVGITRPIFANSCMMKTIDARNWIDTLWTYKHMLHIASILKPLVMFHCASSKGRWRLN